MQALLQGPSGDSRLLLLFFLDNIIITWHADMTSMKYFDHGSLERWDFKKSFVKVSSNLSLGFVDA